MFSDHRKPVPDTTPHSYTHTPTFDIEEEEKDQESPLKSSWLLWMMFTQPKIEVTDELTLVAKFE